MAKSIMADPTVKKIVTDSGKRAAKAKKKATVAMFAAPLAISADTVLRQQATNRAREFWTSSEADLADAKRYWKASTQFQNDHVAKYGRGADWEDKWVSDYGNTYLQNKLQVAPNISDFDRRQLNEQVRVDMADDLAEYKKLLEMSMDYRLTDFDKIEEAESKYFKPYETAAAKHMRNMVNNAGLLPSAINFVMGEKRWQVGEETPEILAMQEFKNDLFISSNKWNAQEKKYEQAISNNKLNDFFVTATTDAKQSEVIGGFNKYLVGFASNDKNKDYNKGPNAAQVKYNFEQDGVVVEKSMPATSFTTLLSEGEAPRFWEQTMAIASALKYHQVNSGENAIYRDGDFIDGALQIMKNRITVLDEDKGIMETAGDVISKGFGGGAKARIIFKPFDPQELSEVTMGNLNGGGIIDISGVDPQVSRRLQNDIQESFARGGDQLFSVPNASIINNLYQTISATDNTGSFIRPMNRNEIEETEKALLNEPQSGIRDAALNVIAVRKSNLSSPQAIQDNIGSTTTTPVQTVDDFGNLVFIDVPTKAKEEEVKKIYDSVEGVLADQKTIDPIGALRKAGKLIMDSLPSLPTEEDMRLQPYTQEALDEAATDVKTYVDETVPVVKKAAEDFIKAAPAKIKKAATVVSKEANDVFNQIAKLDNYIATGDFAQDVGIESERLTRELVAISKQAAEKVKEFYDDTENVRRDIKDQARLMTFYDDFTTDNWNQLKRDIADTYEQFARDNNIDITKTVQKVTATWLAKMIEDTMPVSGRTMAQMSMQRQKFDMKQDAAQDIVDFTRASSQNVGLLSRREDKEEN